MTTVVLFHHALGLTAGVRSFADQLQAQGHTVMVPDLYEGRTFASLAEGVAHAAVPPSVFGTAWPAHVPLQMHLNAYDPLAEEDLAAARALASQPGAELFLYLSRGHLVADPGSVDYDQSIASQILERTLAFLRQHAG